MWPNPHKTADLVTFTEETLNGKLFFCAVSFVLPRFRALSTTHYANNTQNEIAFFCFDA